MTKLKGGEVAAGKKEAALVRKTLFLRQKRLRQRRGSSQGRGGGEESEKGKRGGTPGKAYSQKGAKFREGQNRKVKVKPFSKPRFGKRFGKRKKEGKKVSHRRGDTCSGKREIARKGDDSTLRKEKEGKQENHKRF